MNKNIITINEKQWENIKKYYDNKNEKWKNIKKLKQKTIKKHFKQKIKPKIIIINKKLREKAQKTNITKRNKKYTRQNRKETHKNYNK